MQRIKAWLINRKRLSKQIPYRNRRIRFFVLFLLSMVVFGNMYTFNNPQALQDSIMKELQISETQFNMLYTVIALPNIVCPFFIGIIIDFIGIKVAAIGLTFAVVVLQIIVAQGAVNKNYNTMIIGRLLFGIAMQGLNVVQTCFVSYWFLGKELAFALGIATTIPELGSALNSYVTPLIYQQTKSLGPPLYASVGICFISFICCCIAVYIDKRADNADKQRSIREESLSQFNSETEPQAIKCQDLKQLSGTFWLFVCICMFSIAQYIPFLDNVNKLLQVRFCFSQFSAGKNIMITYLLTSVIGLPLGILVDRIGFKRYFTVTGMALYFSAHLIIYIFPQCNHMEAEPTWTGASFGLLILGLAYCFYANCILPSIPAVVSRKVIGSAFGIMLVLQNFAMAICPLIAGQIIEHSQTQQAGYKNQSLFYVIIGVMGFIISINLFFINKNSKIKLDGTSKQKKLLAVDMNNYIQFLQAGETSPNSQMMKSMNLKQKLLETQENQKPLNKMQSKSGRPIESFQIEI